MPALALLGSIGKNYLPSFPPFSCICGEDRCSETGVVGRGCSVPPAELQSCPLGRPVSSASALFWNHEVMLGLATVESELREVARGLSEKMPRSLTDSAGLEAQGR